MYICAYFASSGTPATGLSPTVDVYDVSDNSLDVDAQAMSEIGGGFYKYDFSGFDTTKDYVIVCDGTSSLTGAERYAVSGSGDSGRSVQILADTNELQSDWVNAGRLDTILDTIAGDVVNLDGSAMRGTDSAALASVCTEGRLAELDAANIPTDLTSIAGDTSAILLDTGTDGVVVSSLSAGAIDSIIDETVEGSVTLRQAIKLVLSLLTGKSSGGGTTTLTFRDIGDTKDRLIVTVDSNGNRTAVGTRDGS